MRFTPRTTRPSVTDLHWIQVSSGGYNRCISVYGNSVMPNCTGYAFGRFMEIMGTTSCNLSTANAGEWYYHTADGYERGKTPRLGAVICWSNPGKAGHVAIVEQINSDGSILISESGYQSVSYFWTSTLQPGYKYGSTYVFQGFIYNPGVQNTYKIEAFIKEAKYHINEKNKSLLDWLMPKNKHKWTAAFVVGCAKKVGGLLDVIIPDCQSPGEFAENGIDSGMGTFVKSSKAPKAGDIILLRTILKHYDSKYECDDIGVVTDVEKNVVVVAQGTSQGIVEKKTYKTTSKEISGYYRPFWSKVDNNQSLMFGYGQLGKFYDTENTEEDAAIREVGYISADYKPTTTKSKIRLSVINYTTLMSAIMDDLLVPGLVSGSVGDNVILDGIENQNARIVIQQLLSKGLNAASAIGIAANIQHESGFRADVIEYGYSFYNGGVGLCQWTNSPRTSSIGRKTNMVNYVGENWRNNITGQVDFLWNELQTSYTHVLSDLSNVPNTESGARNAADFFVRKFEIPSNIDLTTLERQKTASSLWSKIVIQMTTTSTNGISSGINSGNIMNGNVIEIPSSVNQSGITGNYTYYDRVWADRTIQRQIYDKWVSKGKPQNRRIATLDGYYMCAVAPIFGTTGDRISVVLDDGTVINCILADAKGRDAQSQWGHLLGGQVDIIEWEALVGHPSEIDLSGWKGKKVRKIINGGKYQI